MFEYVHAFVDHRDGLEVQLHSFLDRIGIRSHSGLCTVVGKVYFTYK